MPLENLCPDLNLRTGGSLFKKVGEPFSTGLASIGQFGDDHWIKEINLAYTQQPAPPDSLINPAPGEP